MIRIKAEDHAYHPPNTAFLYADAAGQWSCVLANGTPASFSYAGIDHNKEAECRLLLSGVTDARQAMSIIETYARRYQSGPRAPKTVYSYSVLQAPASPAGGVYLHVFHGRDTVDEDMEDWGFDGPVIGPLRYVHTTYQCDVKFACSEEVARKFFDGETEGMIGLVNGLLPYQGKLYGDWSVFGPEMVTVADDGVLVAL